jgi:hypothetical protein
MPHELTPLEKAVTEAFGDGRGCAIIVLRHLAQITGFLSALPKGADASILVDHNARRAVFGELYEILMLSTAGRQVLAEALRPPETQPSDEE